MLGFDVIPVLFDGTVALHFCITVLHCPVALHCCIALLYCTVALHCCTECLFLHEPANLVRRKFYISQEIFNFT